MEINDNLDGKLEGYVETRAGRVDLTCGSNPIGAVFLALDRVGRLPSGVSGAFGGSRDHLDLREAALQLQVAAGVLAGKSDLRYVVEGLERIAAGLTAKQEDAITTAAVEVCSGAWETVAEVARPLLPLLGKDAVSALSAVHGLFEPTEVGEWDASCTDPREAAEVAHEVLGPARNDAAHQHEMAVRLGLRLVADAHWGAHESVGAVLAAELPGLLEAALSVSTHPAREALVTKLNVLLASGAVTLRTKQGA